MSLVKSFNVVILDHTKKCELFPRFNGNKYFDYILNINNREKIIFKNHHVAPSEEKLIIIVSYLEDVEYNKKLKDKVDLNNRYQKVPFGIPFYSSEFIQLSCPYYYGRKSFDEFIEVKLNWCKMLGLKKYEYNIREDLITYERI